MEVELGTNKIHSYLKLVTAAACMVVSVWQRNACTSAAASAASGVGGGDDATDPGNSARKHDDEIDAATDFKLVLVSALRLPKLVDPDNEGCDGRTDNASTRIIISKARRIGPCEANSVDTSIQSQQTCSRKSKSVGVPETGGASEASVY